MPKERFTPEDILELESPTEGFLCPMSANVYEIDFLSFQISDFETKLKIFTVSKDNPPPSLKAQLMAAATNLKSIKLDENIYRKIRYEFSEDILRLPTIMTSLIFKVGNREVPDFRMIERHYFRDELIKSYDFSFGFCIPNSTNTWDAVYSVPPLEEGLIQSMINNPYLTKSDSFYFVGDELIMHNKAEYKYILEDNAQEKKSYHSINDKEENDKNTIYRAEGKNDHRNNNNYYDHIKSDRKWSKEEDYDDR